MSIITFATHYVDTTVTTNVSTVTRTLNYTSTAKNAGAPTILYSDYVVDGPWVTQTGLNGSIATTFGAILYVSSYL